MTRPLCEALPEAVANEQHHSSVGAASLAAYAEVVVTLPASMGKRLAAGQIEAIRDRVRGLLEVNVAPEAKVILLVNPGEIEPHVTVFLLVADADSSAAESMYLDTMERLAPQLRVTGSVSITPVGDTPTRTLTDVPVTHRVDVHLVERVDAPESDRAGTDRIGDAS